MSDREQFGAIPYKLKSNGEVQVLLIKTLRSGRWIVPKGWLQRDNPRLTVVAEAYEEAGVMGEVGAVPLGTIKCRKRIHEVKQTCRLTIFAASRTNFISILSQNDISISS